MRLKLFRDIAIRIYNEDSTQVIDELRQQGCDFTDFITKCFKYHKLITELFEIIEREIAAA